MKDPKDWYIYRAAGFSAAGFLLTTQFPASEWTVATTFIVAQLFGIAGIARWLTEGLYYDTLAARMQLNMDRQQLQKDESATEKAKVDNFIPIHKTMPQVNTYPQLVEMPKFDLERRFAMDILRMYDFDPITQKHVNTTEKLWVETKKMFPQKPFANMKKHWVDCGVLRRENGNKNARFIVADRGMVHGVASGVPLP